MTLESQAKKQSSLEVWRESVLVLIIEMPKVIWITAFGTLISAAAGYAYLEYSKQRDERLRSLRKWPYPWVPAGVPDDIPEFVYQPLGDPRLKSIRLIELLPHDADPSQIRIRLRTTSIAVPKSEHYEAISYCWGDATNVRSIYCKGSKLWITASLRNALLRLHSKNGETRILWADAICINRKDLDGKNWQVRTMSDIYKKAVRVMMYPGEDSYDSDLLEDFIPYLVQAKMRIENAVSRGELIADTRLTREQRKRYDYPTYDLTHCKCFLAMMMITSRPWFRRVLDNSRVGSGEGRCRDAWMMGSFVERFSGGS